MLRGGTCCGVPMTVERTATTDRVSCATCGESLHTETAIPVNVREAVAAADPEAALAIFTAWQSQGAA